MNTASTYKKQFYLLEEDLIKGCIARDRNSQNKLYQQFSPKMFAVCCRYSKSREEAQDILQEGFIKVFDHIKNFKNEGSLEGWIRKIMVNTALQKYRKESHLYAVVSMDDVRIGHYSPDDTLSQIGTKELLVLIQKLPPACQAVFNLYVFEGLKHKEIASLLGVSEGTSKSNLSDARALLQRAVLASSAIAKPAVNADYGNG